ncbi:alpha/beta fold hydrolase [Candidatus Laterigemmans baculatus]|uniref:alpha/beta fold hydrolase n=1 Tax=Candidatus Laterigemmans baculatus TaxID=2770505 RepID=UPI0013DCAB37|nr:alpha/beta hydrolase [Candidatus Laterigemmans baculatus]
MHWREFQSLQRVTELGDRFISYVDQGQGPPVVFLHGIPTWGYLWHGMLPALSTECRTLILDLPGFGYSDKRDCFDRSIARQAEMVDGWMEQIGVERAAVVAHDIGGGVALRLATLFPHRVERLCLLNAVCYDSWPIEAMLQFGHPETYHKVSASAAVTLLRQALKQGFSHKLSEEVLEGLLSPCRTEVGKVSMIRNAAALNTNLTTELTHLLPRIEVPTQILWGEDDTFQLVKYGQRLESDIPDARLVRISDARHFVMFDQPDEVNEHLRAFLAVASTGPLAAPLQ